MTRTTVKRRVKLTHALVRIASGRRSVHPTTPHVPCAGPSAASAAPLSREPKFDLTSATHACRDADPRP